MVRWYPEDLVRLLEGRYAPEAVHSLVIVTKFPEAVLAEPLRSVLARYDQVAAQVTITGLGGTAIEPRVPPPEAALASLPALIDFLGRPERVAVRIDPIVHWRPASAPGPGPGGLPPGRERDGDRNADGGGRPDVKSNLALFGELARAAAGLGVSTVKTSLATPYPKVLRRFRQAGLELVDPSGDWREEVLRHLEREAGRAGVKLDFCCEPARPHTACIDTELLARLHPAGLPARLDRASGQREHCGCSHSIDLAWYASHPCPSGCLYCYANPAGTGPAGGPEPLPPTRVN